MNINLIEMIESILGEAPNDTILYFYYVLGGLLIALGIKLIFKIVFDYILNIRI